MLTFRDEVKFMWSKSSMSKVSTLLYAFCRYALLANVLYLLAVAGKLGDECGMYCAYLISLSADKPAPGISVTFPLNPLTDCSVLIIDDTAVTFGTSSLAPSVSSDGQQFLVRMLSYHSTQPFDID